MNTLGYMHLEGNKTIYVIKTTISGPDNSRL